MHIELTYAKDQNQNIFNENVIMFWKVPDEGQPKDTSPVLKYSRIELIRNII